MRDWERRDERRELRRRWRRRIRVALAITSATFLLGSVAVIGVMTWHGREAWSMDLAPLASYRPALTVRVLARDGSVLAELPSSAHEGDVEVAQLRTLVALRDLPPAVPAAFLAAEDADFFRHEGLDYRGMLRAAWVNLRSGRLAQGASTITQQTIKNVLFHNERSLSRKSQELILAGRVEHALGKERILEIYLNEIFFGCGRYGIEEAAQHFFGVSARDLDVGQAAVLAGLPKAPSQLNPHKDPAGALARQHYVLEQMRSHGLASDDEIERALRNPPVFRSHEASRAESVARDRDFGEVVTLAKRAAARTIPADQLSSAGLEIRTTIDPTRQRVARESLQTGLDRLERRHGYGRHARVAAPGELETLRDRQRPMAEVEARSLAVVRDVQLDDAGRSVLTLDLGASQAVVIDPIPGASIDDLRKRFIKDGVLEVRVLSHGDKLPAGIDLEQPTVTVAELTPGPQGAVLVIELETNDVIAWVGGRDRASSELDRVRQAVREVGSTIKPILASVGLEARSLTPASIFPSSDNVALTLRRGLARSDNQVARAMVDAVGFSQLDARLGDFGLDTTLPHDSTLAMGNVALSPLQVAAAYTRFARGGTAVDLRVVESIRGVDGTCWSCEGASLRGSVEKEAATGQVRRTSVAQRELHADLPALPALEPAVAQLMTSMLRSVIEEGTASSLNDPKLRAVAGKTGTTDEAHDVWFVGYTGEHLAVVWLGFDQPRSLGDGESGGRTALPIWRDAMNGLLEPDRSAHPASAARDGAHLSARGHDDLDSSARSLLAGLELAWISDRTGAPPCRVARQRYRPGRCEGFFFMTCEPAGYAPSSPYWLCEDLASWRLERFLPPTQPAALVDPEVLADVDRRIQEQGLTLATRLGTHARDAEIRLVTLELFTPESLLAASPEEQVKWRTAAESWTAEVTRRVQQALHDRGLLHPGALQVGERFAVRLSAAGSVLMTRVEKDAALINSIHESSYATAKADALRSALAHIYVPMTDATAILLDRDSASTELIFERLSPPASRSRKSHD